ncbi:MAG: ATP-grasp domain-containing protein [Gammaproteobacteria bacterium]
MSAPAVYVIHENNEWVEPLRRAFEEQGIPFAEWFIDGGTVDLSGRPPEGVFYNRMSASSHTRAHRYAVELTGPLLAWLQHHGRRVVNGRRALQLEVSKFEQYLALHSAGVRTPATIAANGTREIVAAARALDRTPFILKPNRGGKGLGVRLFNTVAELERHLADKEDGSLDGIELVQEYIRPANGSITRMEFIGGAFYYQVDVDTAGGFELCPADACEVGEQFCPAPGQEEKKTFQLAARAPDPGLVANLERFFRANDAEVAAAEYVENARGERFVYDINMNTNYNQQAERDAGNGQRAMHRVAEFLGGELVRLYPPVQAP